MEVCFNYGTALVSNLTFYFNLVNNRLIRSSQFANLARTSWKLFFYFETFYPSRHSDITTPAPPTTPAASTLPMTTFGATTTAPTTVPGVTPAGDCEEGRQDCGEDTETPFDYDVVTGKPRQLRSLLCVYVYSICLIYVGDKYAQGEKKQQLVIQPFSQTVV